MTIDAAAGRRRYMKRKDMRIDTRKDTRKDMRKNTSQEGRLRREKGERRRAVCWKGKTEMVNSRK